MRGARRCEPPPQVYEALLAGSHVVYVGAPNIGDYVRADHIIDVHRTLRVADDGTVTMHMAPTLQAVHSILEHDTAVDSAPSVRASAPHVRRCMELQSKPDVWSAVPRPGAAPVNWHTLMPELSPEEHSVLQAVHEFDDHGLVMCAMCDAAFEKLA